MSVEQSTKVGPKEIASLGAALNAVDQYSIRRKYFDQADIVAYRQAKARYLIAVPFIADVLSGLTVPGQEEIVPFYLKRGVTNQIIDILNRGKPAFDANSRFATGRGKFILWLMERGECGYCDTWIANPTIQSQADHIVPYYDGGRTEQANMVCACVSCNKAKGAMDPLEFMEKLAEPDGQEWRDELYKAQNEYFRIKREEEQLGLC